MTILALNAHAHDAGIAVLEDGQPRFVLEEERVSRIKKTTAFPVGAIAALRRQLDLRLRDVDEVVFPWRGDRFVATIAKEVLRGLPRGLHLLRPAASPNMNIAAALRFYRVGAELAHAFEEVPRPRVRYVSHHLAHAGNAFFLSPFDSAAVLVMDAYGDDCSTSLYHATGTSLRLIRKNRFFESLGIVYSLVTKHLGFRTILDEGSVMALAAHGTEELYAAFREIVPLLPGGDYAVARPFFEYYRYGEMRPMSATFVRTFGPPRQPGEPITQRHMDLAWALQRVTEDTVLHVARWLRHTTGERRLCFGGGIALNCLTNFRLATESGFDQVFVSPNPNDSGVALGAALARYHDGNGGGGRRMDPGATGPYLGTTFDDAEIRRALAAADLHSETRDDVAQLAAREVAQGRIVGWFQGRSEMGPRALGNRSILADPRDPFIPDALNEKVKCRPWFRPYAPSVLGERAAEFFDVTPPSPHMSFALPVKAEARSTIPAVLARDGSARVHTVTREQNPLFYDVIDAFHRLTGVPMILNTSFNGQEPTVLSPTDAVRTFLNSGMHVLVMGRHVVRKAGIAGTARRPAESRRSSRVAS